VKDDAFIEYRFAENFARGHGMVFNPGGAAVEGVTSFLYPLALALPARLGLGLPIVAKLVGAAAVLAVIYLCGALVEARGGDATTAQRARFIAATNGTLLVWGQSGMEPAIAAAVVAAAALSLARPHRSGLGIVLLAVGAAIRPEVHLLVCLAAPLVLLRAWRDRSSRREIALGLLAAIALLAAVHATRFHWYGRLVPNTALVKTASLSLTAGLWSLAELAVTGFAGLLIALSLDEARRRRDALALFSAAALIGFAIYLVRVGRDEMILCRLFLPVLPLAITFAALRLGGLAPRLAKILFVLICLCGAGFTIGYGYVTLYWHFGSRSYVPLAETMRARGRAGDLAIFQDLGRTPYSALDLRFIDPVGLVDREIATLYHDGGANPFVRRASADTERRIRDHLFSLRPRFIALVARIGWSYQADAARRFEGGERESLLAPFLPFNNLHVGIESDSRFLDRFRFVEAWHRHDGYYLLLYEARD
jgi:hypothetical protein